MRFLRFFRDDGILFFFGDGAIIFDLLEILNSEREELTFTTEKCSCGNIMGCCSDCPKCLPFLDCLISVYMMETEDGFNIPQLKSVTYSKPTDVHHYIEPSSCTPNLNSKSLAIIKGVANRLRTTNMLDQDLLQSLNRFSGYLVTSGYDKRTILQHFTEILNVSNRDLVFREKPVDLSFKVALVTDMHPALPNMKKLFDRYYPLIRSCPIAQKIFPRESLISTSRKLPNLSTLLAANPFNVPQPPLLLRGFQKTPNCSCKICTEGFFTSIVYPQTSQERGFALKDPINCKSLNVIYKVECFCGKFYVGRTEQPKKRWANHKYHVRSEYLSCNLASHCAEQHRHLVGSDKLRTTEEIKNTFKFTLLESLGSNCQFELLKKREDVWRTRLDTWAPVGLNVRDD